MSVCVYVCVYVKRWYRARVALRQLQETVTGRKLYQNLDIKRSKTSGRCCGRSTRIFCIRTTCLSPVLQLLQRYDILWNNNMASVFDRLPSCAVYGRLGNCLGLLLVNFVIWGISEAS